MSLPLAGKVAVVTGSSRSIGAAIATRLASQGANVVINYVSNASAAQAVADAINSQGAGKAIIVKVDVSSLSDNKQLVAETLRHFGQIDILVLNASVLDYKTLSEVTEEDYDRFFNTNVKSALFLVQEAAPHLKPGTCACVFQPTTYPY